ncbi:MAG: P-type ATPase, partial [bacterium]
KARVLRGAKKKEMDSEELVPGDIVTRVSGAKVPADLRLNHVFELKVEERILTGESVPAEKNFVTLAGLIWLLGTRGKWPSWGDEKEILAVSNGNE